MKKSINYWACPGGGDGSKSISEFLHEAKAAGFEAVELCCGESGELSLDSTEAAVRAIADQARETGIDIASVASGLLWKYSLTSADASVRERAIGIVRKGLEVAAWARTDALLVVPGVVASGLASEAVQYDLAYERSLAAMKDLAPLAEELKVHIAIENVWNGFLLSPMEMAEFVDRTGSDYVGVYFDVGNVLNTGRPEHWIRILGDRIRRIHVKDFKVSVGNLGGFVDLLSGDVNWPEVMNALREIGYDGPLTAEVFPYKYHPEVLIKNTSAAMDAIMGRT